MERKDLTIAQQYIVDRAEEYPSLYPNSRKVFISHIISDHDGTWENGILVPSKYDEHIKKHRLHDDLVSGFFLSQSGYFTIHMYDTKNTPIFKMPDNMHPDWLDYIHHELWSIQRITPELYKKLTIAMCIMHYHREVNTHANHDRNDSEYAKFHAMIPSFLARVRDIRKFQELGKVPPHRYTGMNI